MQNKIWILLLAMTFLPARKSKGQSGGENKRNAGTYILTVNIQDSMGRRQSILPPDSFYVYGHWAIEKITKTRNIFLYGKELPPIIEFDNYAIIDLDKSVFAIRNKLDDLKNLSFRPLKGKTTGFDFGNDNAMYRNEQAKVTSVYYKGVKAKKITYVCNGGPYQGKSVVIYVTDGFVPNRPLLLDPRVEKTFGGNMIEADIDFKDQGMLIIEYSFSNKIEGKYIRAIESLH